MSVPSRIDATLVKALGHPLRVQILEAITERGEASPIELARAFDQPLATVSHHVRMLRDLGWIELLRAEPRRGALEHFYGAVARPFIDDQHWEELPVAMRRGLAGSLFRRIFAEAAQAGAVGGFDDAGAHINRMPLDLDERGWRELSGAVSAMLRKAEEIQDRSDARRAEASGREDGVVRSALAVLHFRLVEPVSPTARARARRGRRARLPGLP
jgi:DNA-binding transcriptional ArsR family regulator